MNSEIRNYTSHNDLYAPYAVQKTSTTIKPHRRTLRFTLIAAALLVLVTIPIAVIIASHFGIMSPPSLPINATTDTTAAPTTTEKVYESITTLPGAILLDDQTKERMVNAPLSPRVGIINPKRLLESIERNQYPIIIGTVESLESVVITNADTAHVYSRLRVTVTEKIAYATEVPETVTVLSHSIYRINSVDSSCSRLFAPDIALKVPEESSFLFALYPDGSQSEFFSIQDKTYHSDHYADYMLNFYCLIFDVPADDRDPAYAGKTAVYNEAGIVATPLDDIRALGKKRNE